jgi:hypothetical protein
MRILNASRQQRLVVPFDAIVPQLVADTKALETFASKFFAYMMPNSLPMTCSPIRPRL